VAALISRPAGVTARLDLIAVVWGGLAASIGLMAGAGRDWPARLAAAALSFGIGGFLAGVRAAGRRIAHAIGAWVAGYAIHAGFILLATVIDVGGGPDAPPLVAGSGSQWLYALGWAFLLALAGGLMANSWLRPASRR
jgi:hypothetical protein